MISSFDQLEDHQHATNGDYENPTLLSVGDSIMWGQGLRPEHRFREIVREKLGVNELSLGRSGALVMNDEELSDEDLDDQEYDDQDFTREIISRTPSVYEQLKLAKRILNNSSGDPTDIQYILMTGGINDFGLDNILLPIQAVSEGYFVKTWPTFISDRFENEIQPRIEKTLRLAVKNFPNATIVYTGYYPVISGYSVAHPTRVLSLGVLWSLLTYATVPLAQRILPLKAAFLEATATASYTWQVVSNKVIRDTIDKVSKEEGIEENRILFARSYIEDDHCMFAIDPMLWEYDFIPDAPRPLDEMDLGEWIRFLAQATPQDEVAAERLEACRRLRDDASAGGHILCDLASMGHPNVSGAFDYAESILNTLALAGHIPRDWQGCERTELKWRRRCADLHDNGVYNCTQVTGKIGNPCDNATDTLWQTAGDLFQKSTDHFKNIGNRAQKIDECNQEAKNERQTCNDEYEQKHADCLNQRSAARQRCRQYRCDEQFDCQARCDHHRCTRYEDCRDRFGRFDPRRAWCLGKRKACEATNTTKRLACRASCAAERELCKAKATAKRVACLAKAEAEFVACLAKAKAEELACITKATAEQVACTVTEVAKMAWDAIRGIALGIASAAVGIATGVTAVVCFAVTFTVNRLCRLSVLIGEGLCRFGKGIELAICTVSQLFQRQPARRVRDGAEM